MPSESRFAALAGRALLAAWLLGSGPLAAAAPPVLGAEAGRPRLGQPLPPAQAGSFSVYPDGRGLPPGRGSVAEGRALYAQHCASCHGAEGEGQAQGLNGGRLVGRAPLALRPGAERTIGNHWPQASTLFDYIRRAMPLQAPGSLPPEAVYALSAWLLHANGLLPEDAVLDAARLAALKLPANARFIRHPD